MSQVQGPPTVLHWLSQETIIFSYSVEVELKFSIPADLFDLRVPADALISSSVTPSEMIEHIRSKAVDMIPHAITVMLYMKQMNMAS